MTNTKACSRCKQILPVGAFNKKASAKDGLNSACRDCSNAMKRNMTPEQRDRKNAKNRKYRAENPEAVRATNHQQYLNKREERIAKATKYVEDHLDQHKLYIKNNRHKHRVKVNASARKRRGRMKQNKSFYISPKEEQAFYLQPCFACKKYFPGLMTVEHLIPVELNGDDGIGNLVTLCKSCNSSKQHKTWMEWRVWRMKRGKPPLPAYAQTKRVFRSLP